MKKIIIERVSLRRERNKGVVKLEAVLSGEKSGTLFFEVAEKFGKFFDVTKADCFVAALLPQAAMDGVDIESRVPVSERLLFQLNTFLCEILGKIYRQKPIHISAPLATGTPATAGAVGTGITCGVDSLYTVAEYSKTAFPHQNLTHLCLFNVGSHHIGAEDAGTMERTRIELAERFCRENGLEFLCVNSNVHDFSPKYARYFSILNASAALALPKLFSAYYSSSGYSVEEFHMTATDLAHFELFVLTMLSTETLAFYSTGAEVSRLKKVERLAAFPPSYTVLNVCNLHAHNCGVCIKCLRTLYALDILDALDQYASVFDIENYRRHHSRFIAQCWVRKFFARDDYSKENWAHLRKKYSVPVGWIFVESLRFIFSRLKIYSPSYILYRLRDARK